MTAQEFTPEKSLELITRVINEAKVKFEENGFTYILWGALIFATSLAQFILIQLEVYEYNYYPYFIMPIGGVISWLHFRKKKISSSRNVISSMISATWLALGLNLLVLGFFYSSYFKTLLIPVMLVLLGVGYVMSGASIRSRLVVVSGLIINISAFVCIHIPWAYHSLVLSLVSLLFVFAPGLVLKFRKLKNRV